MWEDSRGTLDAVARGVAHHERSKDRRDEQSSQQHSPSGSHLPGWLLPVGAAVVVLALVGGGVAVATRSGGDSSSGTSGAAGTRSGGSGGAGASSAGTALARGISFTGPVTFNNPKGNGTVSFRVRCDPDCTVTADDVSSLPAGFVPIIKAAVEHAYTGSGGSWAFAGTPVSSCSEVTGQNVFQDPSRWGSTLAVSETALHVEAVMPGFDLKGGGAVECSATALTMTFDGTPAS